MPCSTSIEHLNYISIGVHYFHWKIIIRPISLCQTAVVIQAVKFKRFFI